MTEEETFWWVVNKLREQGKPSYGGNNCMLRGSDGTKCAVGWLVPDEDYHPGLEQVPVVLLANYIENWGPYNYDFINHIRVMHDYWARICRAFGRVVDFDPYVKTACENLGYEYVEPTN